MFRRKTPPVPDPTAWRKAGTPLVERTTYSEASDFYLPLLAGPETFVAQMTGAPAVRSAAGVLERLEPDAYSRFLLNFYREGLGRFGESWRYADINTVLQTVAAALPVRDYLEIGVRRGRSLAMVASVQPDANIVGFDLWVEDYAGMPNPGPELVQNELKKLGHRGTLELVSGDSHETVPRYFARHPERWFDVITVDGDHTLEGARADLETAVARLRIGGALVFDDVCSQYHPYLSALWDEFTADVTRWASWRYDDVGFGIGVAIKKQ